MKPVRGAGTATIQEQELLRLDHALDATGAKLERRIKIQTEQGVRELTHKELLLLLARRAKVESDLQEGRKPRYKKCEDPECVLLIPATGHTGSGNRKWCQVHKRKKHNLKDRARHAKNPERRRAQVRKSTRVWYAENRKEILQKARARRIENHAEITERQRIYREKKRELLRARNREYKAAHREELREKQRVKYASLTPDQKREILAKAAARRAAKKAQK